MTSIQLLSNFTLDQWDDLLSVSILSVSNNTLLISYILSSHLFIYSREGHHLTTITTDERAMLCDATWTPRGNIVYALCKGRVVVMSESGKIITAHSHIRTPQFLSISYDDAIYLADWTTGVYQSTDDGFSWSLVFNSTDGWHCLQVIKVTTDHSDDFWTLEENGINTQRLRVYSVDKRRSDSNVMWMDKKITATDGIHIKLSNIRMSNDGNMNIFLSDNYNKAVHMLSKNGQYHCQLLSPHRLKGTPSNVAVDKVHQLLYVGQEKRVVVFKLIYKARGD